MPKKFFNPFAPKDGDQIYDKKYIDERIQRFSSAVKFNGERYAVSGIHPTKKACLLIHDITAECVWVDIEYVALKDKKDGEPYGFDLITVIHGKVVERAGRYRADQMDMRKRFYE